MSNIRVFVIDDSAVVRKILTEQLNKAPGIEVIGAAQDPIFAESKMKSNWPDVIVLDVEMPRMDGITFLKKIMAEHPTPVVMCSTLTAKGSQKGIQALSAGAIDVVEKPKMNLNENLAASSSSVVQAVKNAAKANVKAKSKPARAAKPYSPSAVPSKQTADAVLSTVATRGVLQPMVAIGTSTGGTQALEQVLPHLPKNTLPILIVQHMPAKFTSAFAERLNNICQITVREAADLDPILPGQALIAPGGQHMYIDTKRGNRCVTVLDGPPVNRHKPSADVLFRSIAKISARQTLGIIMTGMGDDGAVGLNELRAAGAETVGQNKDTCIVYGMPAVAFKLGAVQKQVPLQGIAQEIINFSAKYLK